MSKSLKQNYKSPTNNKRVWLLILGRSGIALGGILLIGLIGGAWRLWSFIQKDLTPLAEKSLTTTLNRPVKLGEVKGFSLTGVKFGTSAIPATPTDPDSVAVDTVEVGFEPLQLLFKRELKLDVTLVNPDVYVEQDQQGRWITTIIKRQGQGQPIQTDLDKIRFRNAQLVLVPRKRDIEDMGDKGDTGNNASSPLSSPVRFSQVNGTAQLVENYQVIRLDLTGKPSSGGDVALKGDIRPQTWATNLQIRGQELLASDVTRLVKLPLSLQAGRVNGDLQMQFQIGQTQPPILFGNVDLQAVQFQVPKVPQPFLNTQGKLHFQGTEIKLDNVIGSYGKIPLIANGTIDTETGYKLAGRVNGVNVADVQETLKLKLPVPVTGEVQADLQFTGKTTEPILTGIVTTNKPAQIDKVDFDSASGKFEFALKDEVIVFEDIQGKAKVGGEVKGTGKVELGTVPRLNFNLSAKDVPGDAIALLYNSQPGLKVGTVFGTAQMTGTADNVQTIVQFQAPQAQYPTTGEVVVNSDRTLNFRNVALSVAGGKVQVAGSWNNQNWQAIADATGVQIEPFVNPQQLENINLNDARFNGRLILSGSSAPFKLGNIRTQNAKVKVADGTVAVSQIQLGENSFSAKLVADSVRLSQLLKQPVPALQPALQAAMAGTFQVSGNTNNFDLKTLRGNGSASLAVKTGTVTATNIQVANGVYQAQLQANNAPLQQLTPVPQQLHGQITGKFNVTGSVESFQPETIQANGQAKLNVGGGSFTATNIQVANGRYQVVVNAAGVDLNRFQEELKGKFGGKAQVAGNLGSSKLADIRATGQVNFSQGLAGIERPLTALVGWDGEKLLVERATAPGLNASGYILANSNQAGIPEITELNLDVQAQNYNLQQLPLKLPQTVDLAGKADFNGKITGNLPVPNLVGKLTLRDLNVNNLAFESVLNGNIQSVQGRGLNLDVTGKHDKIAVNLDGNNRPNSFTVQWQQASAIGQAQGDNLATKVENFPLKVLNLPVPASTYLGQGEIAGSLSGDFLINQNTLAVAGDVAIAQPQVGRIKGDRLQALFRYEDGKTTLTDSAFIKGNSRYAFTGEFTPTATTPQIKGKLNISQGEIQDILTTLQFFELQDFQRGTATPTYGKASDLNTVAVGSAGQPILDQIRRFSEIKALIAQQQQRRDVALVPDLADLKGTFNGEIDFDTATENGLTADFKLNGQNFVWGRESEPNHLYTVEQVIAHGSFENGVLRLLPLRIESQDQLIAFTGNVGGTEQSGQLRVKNFPLEVLSNYVNLPMGATGNINATATLAGSVNNPQARGELQITQGTLNQKGIESATASFSYHDGRLNFGSNVMVAGSEPVTITGSVPAKLPFATAAPPDSDQINLDVQVKNEGLAILNLLTDQLAFEKGQGEVNLTVRGTKEQPIVNGIAAVKDATFSAQALPGKLTDVTGKAQFDFDRIKVESLQGNFSQGNIIAQGEIPIFTNSQKQIDHPLNVSLNQLAVNLKGRYQGGVSGNLQITGSALSPVIGGNLKLANGQVLITESANNAINAGNSHQEISYAKTNKPEKSENYTTVTRFNDLKLELGKNVEIALPPILSFRATGSLNVNGSFNNPEPEGTIRLRGGDVNLFTTQFNLARGYKNRAVFRGDQNPDLDIRLFANVLDVNPSQVTITPFSSEISDENITSFQPVNTVRVEARIDGPASQFNQNLELTSNPPRNQTEIVALLGGGFVQTLGRGDSTLGLVNLAGSALNIQRAFNQIGNAFGLSELRIFPTVASDDPDNPEVTRRNFSMDLAAEAGIDVSRNISFSALKVLTSDEAPQFGVNYRINSEFRLRTSTDLSGDNQAVLEYEDRF
ncbi:translocation/assembly module TamB domain-containing protein [Fischerella thermalis]|uniref:translocation/assembly module TamB domain-containing protein n=1 Tax=Fischerella thermalis TaxID=372787 RepID=UPI0019EE71F1|nr:translocation/assembly module TamB [Fischerella thermalis]MBF1991846.1 translocation/assembly module TamB domain-containing protein [Fischerella thermalis M58_A2018_009]MBF2060443.1 translocation/assembly module TamB domain-containing protein [Fischerella thermalis M66_A2018_004]